MLLHSCLPLPMRLPLLLGVCSPIACSEKFHDLFVSWELPWPWTSLLPWVPSSFWPSPLLLFSTLFPRMSGKMCLSSIYPEFQTKCEEQMNILGIATCLWTWHWDLCSISLSVFLSGMYNCTCLLFQQSFRIKQFFSSSFLLGPASHVKSSTSST